MNTTSEQSIASIISQASLDFDATSDKKVKLSEGIPSTTLPRELKPHKKISKKKNKSKRRIKLREMIHFNSDEEEELNLDWENFIYACRPRDDQD